MTRVVEDSVAPSRLYTGLLTLLASLALLLAAAGIFAVISWTVSKSTHEIGIRMALGASRRDVLGKILGRVLAESLAGAVLGIAGSIALTRVLETLLYGVTRTDAATFTLAAVVLAAVALLAAYLPGRRAIAIDPMKALRTE
jgi:putative ABC transport system permease protein